MPFGHNNAAQTFQRLMDDVLGDLDFFFVYLDDILVASRNLEEHKQHLIILFNSLQEHGLIIKLEKCQFEVLEIDFLGHAVDKHGIKPLASKVMAIKEFPKPTNVKALQRFVAMVNFYRSFVPHAAGMLQPLYQALTGGKTRTGPKT